VTLDVTVKDGLFEFRHTFSILGGDIQEVANDTISGQVFEHDFIPLPARLVDTVLLGEDMHYHGWNHIFVSGVLVPLGDLLKDKLRCSINLLLIKHQGDIESNENDVSSAKVVLGTPHVTHELAWSIDDMQTQRVQVLVTRLDCGEHLVACLGRFLLLIVV
jgi:hypothetical protein